jgi:CheY-like chemotaxis protein
MDTLEAAKRLNKLRRALLIDDDQVSQLISRLIIEQVGLVEECISHYNGATALQLLKDEQQIGLPLPEVILVDLKMPIMNGLEFLQRLNEQADLSFLLKSTLVLSSSNSPRDVAKARELGARWYLIKPLTSETLTPILTTLLQERNKPVGEG